MTRQIFIFKPKGVAVIRYCVAFFFLRDPPLFLKPDPR